MKKTALLLLLGYYSSWAWSHNASEMLYNKLNAMSTMTARFSQVVTVQQKEVARSSGSMALQRPGRFRWQTNQPMQQLLVADGKQLWIYDIELEQVTIKKLEKGLGGTAALFLSGYDNQVTKNFDVTDKKKGLKLIFELKAKTAKENFQRIKFIFNQKQLTSLELYDQLGQTTYVTLSQIKMNQHVPSHLFQFQPPTGVDIIRQ